MRVPVAIPALQTDDSDSSLAIAILPQPGYTVALDNNGASLPFVSREALAFADVSQAAPDKRLVNATAYLLRFRDGTNRDRVLDIAATALESDATDRCDTDAVEGLTAHNIQFAASHAKAQAVLTTRRSFDTLKTEIDEPTARNLYAASKAFVQHHPGSACAETASLWLAESFWQGRGNSPGALVALAEYYIEEQRPEAALRVLKPAVAQHYTPAVAITGSLLLDRGDAKTAEPFLTEAAGAAPNPEFNHDIANANFQLGTIETRRNHVDQAIKYLTIAVALEPGCARCYLERGQLYVTLGQPSDALADFKKAQQTAAREPDLWPGVYDGASGLLARQSGN